MPEDDDKVRKPKQCPKCGNTTFTIFDDYIECANHTCRYHLNAKITGVIEW